MTERPLEEGHATMPLARARLLVAGVFLVVAAVAVTWLLLDRRPPMWDHANHLERAVLCRQDLARGDMSEIFRRSSFYPPLVFCTAALATSVLRSAEAGAYGVMIGALGVALIATFGVARRLVGTSAGVASAVILGTAPFTVYQTVHFQLDLPLAAVVALTHLVFLRAAGFERLGAALAVGAAVGAGFLTKPTFPVYVLPVVLWGVATVRSRRGAGHVAVAGVVALCLDLPWYGPRLVGLPAQFLSRSYKQALQEGDPDPISLAALGWYPRILLAVLGVGALLLLCWGLVQAGRRRRWLLLAMVAFPVGVLVSVRNKDARYLLPLLPSLAVVAGLGLDTVPGAARRGAVAGMVLLGAFQVSASAFKLPPTATIPWTDLEVVIPVAPDPADWKQSEVLAALTRLSRGQAGTVSIAPNAAYFSVSNFRYFGVRDGLPLRFVRGWDEVPLGIDYMVLKTGDVGPSWGGDKARRIAAQFERDMDLASVFPVAGTWTLPDGSTATLRARNLERVPEVTPARLTRDIEEAVRRRVPEFARDVRDLSVTVVAGDDVRHGRVRRLELSVGSATVGDLRRARASTIRVHGLRVVVEDLLVNPWSAHRVGRFDPLDVGRLRVVRAEVLADDLRAFLAEQRGLRGMEVRLEPGSVRFRLLPGRPSVVARLHLVPATDRPFALVVDDFTVGGLHVPGLLVDWVVRHYDPTRRLASQLPFAVTIAPVTIDPGAVRIGGEGGEN